MTTVGSRIREARKAAGLTQSKLARHVGCESMTISRYETGNIESPDSTKLRLIAEATGRSAHWLLTGEEEPSSATPPAADPPHWREWLDKSEVVDDFSETQLEGFRRLASRSFSIRSWTDLEQIADRWKHKKPSATAARKRKALNDNEET